MRILVEIEVDEETVKEASGLNDLEEAISTELAWINQSGMSVIDWKTLEE